MASDPGMRRSSRSTIGVPPQRWGFETEAVEGNRDQQGAVPTSGNGSRAVSARSRTSSAQHSGSSRRAVLEAEIRVAKAQLELRESELAAETLVRTSSVRSPGSGTGRSPSLGMQQQVFAEAAEVLDAGEEAPQGEPHDNSQPDAVVVGLVAGDVGDVAGHVQEIESDAESHLRREFQLKELRYQQEIGYLGEQLNECRKESRRVKDRAQSIVQKLEVAESKLRVAQQENRDLLQTSYEKEKSMYSELEQARHELAEMEWRVQHAHSQVCDESTAVVASRVNSPQSVNSTDSRPKCVTHGLSACQMSGSHSLVVRDEASSQVPVPASSDSSNDCSSTAGNADSDQCTGQGTIGIANMAQEFMGALTAALRSSGNNTTTSHSTTPDSDTGLHQLAARHSSINTKLPMFSGRPEEWPTFISTYRSSTKQCGFSNAENVQRLQACLKGKARDAVQLMLSVPDNVEQAVQTLERRFGRPELVVTELIEQAKSLKPVRADDPDSLIGLATAINNIVLTMKLLNSQGHLTNPALRNELVTKLPPAQRMQWGEYLKTQGLTTDQLGLDTFSAWLGERAEAAALLAPAKSLAQPTTTYKPRGQTALHAASSSANEARRDKPVWSCRNCNGSHCITWCRSFKALPVKQRRELVYEWKLCTCCLRSGHWRAACQSGGCERCPARHHTLLHQERTQRTSGARGGSTTDGTSGAREGSNTDGTQPQAATNHQTSASMGDQIAFMTVPVVLEYEGRQQRVTSLLDPASTTSFLTDDAASKLGIVGKPQSLQTTVLGGKTVTGQHQCVEVTMRSVDGNYSADLEVWTQPQITTHTAPVNWDKIKCCYEHLRDIPLPPTNTRTPELLVGLNVPGAHTTLEEVVGNDGDPIARRLPLGWVCFGPVVTPSQCSMTTAVKPADDMTPQQRLDAIVEKFWLWDDVGTVTQSTLTQAEIEADRLVREMTTHDGTRIVTGIPWTSDGGRPQLTSNIATAKSLFNLERSLARRPPVYDQYSQLVAQHLEKGYITRFDADVLTEPDQWFLPHFPIVRQDKETTKVRMVFDAAATHDGQSLNDHMYAGPKLQQDLVEVLLGFCQEPVALVGDIAEMFLQVGLKPADRRYVRFLWRESPQSTMEAFEFNRLVFGLKASPYLACRAVKEVGSRFGSNYSDMARSAIDRSLYVDDLLKSCPTTDSAITTQREVQSLLQHGSFHLRKWRSNDRQVLEAIPEADRATDSLLHLSSNDNPTISNPVKTLGVAWNARDDVFTFVYKATSPQQLTKRSVLSKMATIYDPRGQLSPFTIRARLMFQELCTQQKDWDAALSDEQSSKWQRWFAELPLLAEIKADRCFKDARRPPESAALSVHVFTDASSHAVATAVYVRCEYPDGFVKVTLAFAKAKTAPIKPTTIPKLELRGAALGVRASQVVARALDIPVEKHVYWTDSTNVLYWLRSNAKNFRSDIATRIVEIQKSTTADQWRHVPGKVNPADLCTRGERAADFIRNDTWWRGPQFLQSAPAVWPKTNLTVPAQLPGQLKKKPAITFAVEHEQIRLSPSTYSSWSRLVRITAWCLRFLGNLRARITRGRAVPTSAVVVPSQQTDGTSAKSAASNSTEQHATEELSPQELQNAELHWIRAAQVDTYGGTIQRLGLGKTLLASDPLQRLNPVLLTIEGVPILTLSGRLKESAHLGRGLQQPMLLPPNHRVTQLLIMQEDQQCHHSAGSQHLLANLRQRFWIVNGLAAVKRARRSCVRCQRMNAKPAEQLMGPVPSVRTTQSFKPFSNCGVDFAGPFLTKQGRSRAQQKRYLCVFTCVETRACHLEMTTSLNADSFLMAFSRFVKRRGNPSVMISDNGTNFVAAERELREAAEQIDWQKVECRSADDGIKWRFSPPRSPHFGGIFEAVVKAAKRALTHVLGKASLTDEELVTAFTEVENILNSRPLTQLSTDPQDADVPTPNHFLVGRIVQPLDLEMEVNASDAVHPRKRWQVVQQHVCHVWTRWMKELVPLLNLRKKWRAERRELQKGDLVLCPSPDVTRGRWVRSWWSRVWCLAGQRSHPPD